MIGTEVVNVVRLELRDTDGEVALVGIGTLNDVVVEEEVKDVDENIVEGIAEEVGVEGGDEELREVARAEELPQRLARAPADERRERRRAVQSQGTQGMVSTKERTSTQDDSL